MPGYFNYGSPQGQIVNLQAPNLSGTNAFELPLRALNQGIRNYIDLGDLNRLNDIEARAKLADQSAGEAYRILSSNNNFDDLSALAKDPDSALSKAMKGMKASEARVLADKITAREAFGRTKAFNEMGDTYAEVMSRINQLTTAGKRQEADALRNTFANHVRGQKSAGDVIENLLGLQEAVDNSRSARAWQGANTAKINQSIAKEIQEQKDFERAAQINADNAGMDYSTFTTAIFQAVKRGEITPAQAKQALTHPIFRNLHTKEQAATNFREEGNNLFIDYTNKVQAKKNLPSISVEIPSPTNKQIASNQTDQTLLPQTASSMLKDASGFNGSNTPVIQSVLLKTDNNDLLQRLNSNAQPQFSQQEPKTPASTQIAQKASEEFIPINSSNATKEQRIKEVKKSLAQIKDSIESGEIPKISIPNIPDPYSSINPNIEINSQGFTRDQWKLIHELKNPQQSIEDFIATHKGAVEAIKQGKPYIKLYHQEENAYQEQQKAKAIENKTLQVFNNPGKVLNDALRTGGDNLNKAQNILNKSIEISKDKLKKAFPSGAVLQESFEQSTLDASTNPGTVQQLANEIGPETQEFLAWADEYNRAHPDRQIDSRMLVIALQRGKVPKKFFANKVGLSNTYKDKNNHEYSFDLNIAQKTAESLAKSYTSEELLNVISVYKALQDKKTALDTCFTDVKNTIGIMQSPYFVSTGKQLQNIQDFYKGIAYLQYLAEDLGRISTSIQSNPLNFK